MSWREIKNFLQYLHKNVYYSCLDNKQLLIKYEIKHIAFVNQCYSALTAWRLRAGKKHKQH